MRRKKSITDTHAARVIFGNLSSSAVLPHRAFHSGCLLSANANKNHTRSQRAAPNHQQHYRQRTTTCCFFGTTISPTPKAGLSRYVKSHRDSPVKLLFIGYYTSYDAMFPILLFRLSYDYCPTISRKLSLSLSTADKVGFLIDVNLVAALPELLPTIVRNI